MRNGDGQISPTLRYLKAECRTGPSTIYHSLENTYKYSAVTWHFPQNTNITLDWITFIISL